MTADTVIIMGSGPGVLEAQQMARGPDQQFVAINNAWRVRTDWDWLIHPEDFPDDRRPQALASGQKLVGAKDYVPVQNRYGGFVYAGGTMAFTAAYWALGALKPRVIAMIGCDMVYPQQGPTHFYGTGTADPLRDDVTLRSLEAKSARLWVLAAQAGCAVVNLSDARRSRLLYPRAGFSQLAGVKPPRFQGACVAKALGAEDKAGYFVPTGKYWKEQQRFDVDVIDHIDRLWLMAAEQRLMAA